MSNEQVQSAFKQGDLVRVIKPEGIKVLTPEAEEAGEQQVYEYTDGEGHSNVWVTYMDELVGKTLTVVYVDDRMGYLLPATEWLQSQADDIIRDVQAVVNGEVEAPQAYFIFQQLSQATFSFLTDWLEPADEPYYLAAA